MDKPKMDLLSLLQSPSYFSYADEAEFTALMDKALATLEMNNEKPSTSSSSSTKQEPIDKIKDGQSEPKNEDEVENKSLIDKLPQEMLLKILKYLDVKSLSVSRLISQTWNGIAREIIQSRDDVETVFNCKKPRNMNLTFEGGAERVEATLENFIKYFDDSKESPLYTRFRFNDIKRSVFAHADWLKFTRDFGPTVKSLKLLMTGDENFKESWGLAGKLTDLLLNRLPNLQEFGLKFPDGFFERNPQAFSKTELFPTTGLTQEEKEKSRQLPQLKVLYIDEMCFGTYPEVVSDLLWVSDNLQKIEPFSKGRAYKLAETFQLLQSFEKLHCVQNAEIYIDDVFIAKAKKTSLESAGFKLKKLDFYAFWIYNSEAFWSDSAVFLSNLFNSSKDNLKELTTDTLGFLPDLQIPEFSKLSKLCIAHFKYTGSHVFPKGLKYNEVFPVLQSLALQVPWGHFFPHDETVSSIPTLKILSIAGHWIKKEDIARISQVCPNLTEFKIHSLSCGSLSPNFPKVGEAIWTHLTKLESLSLGINVDDPDYYFPAVDSCFTGFSGEDCIRLLKVIEKEKAAKKQGSQLTSGSKNPLDAERTNPSILDLKDLKQLKVSLQCRGTSWQSIHKLMHVSKEFAFELMENLTYKVTFD